MDRLSGHGMASEIAPLLCALEYGRAERRTSDAGREMPLFVPRSGGEAGFGLPVEGMAGEQRDCVQTRVSPVPFRLLLGHCFGAYATPGGTAPFCFPDSSPRASLGPCSRMHGLALGSRAHSHGFAQV